MTKIENNAAYVIKRINEIWGERPGKKTLQKIVYLIEQKGIDLGYDFGLHFYGPYSEALDAVTGFLSADGIIEFDYSGYSHLIRINNECFDVRPYGLSSEQKRAIDQLIKRFQGQSASQLELLTTAIYVYDHLEDRSEANIIRGVQKIKGSKYSKEQIEGAFKDFAFFGRPLLS